MTKSEEGGEGSEVVYVRACACACESESTRLGASNWAAKRQS